MFTDRAREIVATQDHAAKLAKKKEEEEPGGLEHRRQRLEGHARRLADRCEVCGLRHRQDCITEEAFGRIVEVLFKTLDPDRNDIMTTKPEPLQIILKKVRPRSTERHLVPHRRDAYQTFALVDLPDPRDPKGEATITAGSPIPFMDSPQGLALLERYAARMEEIAAAPAVEVLPGFSFPEGENIPGLAYLADHAAEVLELDRHPRLLLETSKASSAVRSYQRLVKVLLSEARFLIGKDEEARRHQERAAARKAARARSGAA